jgi:hypothetical protein
LDIAKLYDYESLFSLELRLPDQEDGIGVFFKIRSASSPDAKKVLRQHVDETTERLQRGKLVKGETRLRQELERAASWIAGWDWGDNTYEGVKPEFKFKTVLHILDREDWIYEQVREAANNLANFSAKPKTTSAKP